MNTTDVHRQRDKERNTLREQLEPAAAALSTPELGEIALCSIAISLRRLADAGLLSMGALIGNRARTMSVADAAAIAVSTDQESWAAATGLAAIALANERKGD